jgi:FkbM family methyltransferase
VNYELSGLSTPIQAHSHRKVFKIMCCPEMWHPSWWSFFDELETRESWWNIRPGDIVLDVGADFGSYTLSAFAQGAAQVYAWSPPFKLPDMPYECAALAQSATVNGWQDILAAFPTGLWSEPGFLAAFDGPRPAQFHPTLEAAQAAIAGQEGHCSAFEVHALDALGLSRVDWIKIDTEGCELPILQGGRETIARCEPRILLEHHYHLDPDCETKCDAFLAELGYLKVGTRQHHTVAHSLYVVPA